ncbi:hypothetical protein H2248_011480 [Termitomyces sp. 'cryptogamus']|nr:hypothetical protein H2248_011480 [Termitomyces sp. 'cryptogamus']
MADPAWKEIDTTTIQNCWKKSDILPKSTANIPVSAPSIPVSSLLNTKPTDTINAAEIEVKKALSNLKECAVLQCKNQMDIDELLNPTNENQVYVDGMEEEEINQDICAAVIEFCKAEQDREEKGSDIVDHNSEVIDQNPSCQE